jgi:hypothetical protein
MAKCYTAGSLCVTLPRLESFESAFSLLRLDLLGAL